MIYIDYLKKTKTVTGLYYVELFGQLDAELLKRRPHFAKKKVFFHHANALAHNSSVTTAKLIHLGYELLPHPPYSPDMPSCDHFVSKLGKHDSLRRP